MARRKGSIDLDSNLELLADAPLDARSVVAAKSDLTASGTFNYTYVGMVVTVAEEGKLYVLKGKPYTNIDNWKAVGNVDDEFVTEDDDQNITLPKPQRTWTGTYAEWQALSAAEKAKYEGGTVNITNDEEAGPTEYYSTEEVKTNKVWIDGKPIYRKVVKTGSLPNGTNKSVPHGISNVKFFTETKAMAKNPSTNHYYVLPFVSTTASSMIGFWIEGNNIWLRATADRSAFSESYAILEYTKTTD